LFELEGLPPKRARKTRVCTQVSSMDSPWLVLS
jgi:hypothetical protein